MKNSSTLSDRHNDLTRQLILDAAIRTLEQTSVSELTVRAAAKEANISERTVFRYFATREDFLEGVVEEVRRRLDLPAAPASPDEMLALPRKLYRAFESKSQLTQAALHPALYSRMRDNSARDRWAAIAAIVDDIAPGQGKREKKISAANIRFVLTATAWHYYRFNLKLSLEESIACAETVIRQAVQGLTAEA